MLNIDPLLFQPKVIRMSTTSNVGLPGQHIIRTTEYSNSQVMTGPSTQSRNEANNNNIITNEMETLGDFTVGRRDFPIPTGVVRPYGNYTTNEEMQDATTETNDKERINDLQADWASEQMYWSGDGDSTDGSIIERLAQQDSASMMSFQSIMTNSSASASFHSQLSEQSESKEELICAVMNKVKSQNRVEASKILLAMSNSVENCIIMRQSGCLPLLVRLLHGSEDNANTYHMIHAKRMNFEVRERASQALHNVVFSQPDDKKGRREARVLRLLEQIRDYCDQLRTLDADTDDNRNARCVDQHLGPSVAALMKLSFDEEHRYAMCQLGGLQAIAELLQVDHEVHGCTSDQYCNTIRRYAGMALTNLTFGDGANKALLCSMRPFMEALVAQLYSPSEDLRQVTASVLRNLSWRADASSKKMLREVGAVTTLVKAAMEAEKESTLKSILSALWNLSAHCSSNKADICQVDGALAFLVSTLTYNSKAKTLAIVENGGGILRNVSSHVAIQNDYRAVLRKHNCLQILLQHLKSPSLTVVSNACGTLWNLSARNAVDQRALWEMGAVGMLKKLINSKHKMISMGSSAALKNLLSSRPTGLGLCVSSDGYKYNTDMPSLHVRKQKALSTEIDENLSETYDNTDSPKTSPIKTLTDKNRSRRHISPSARYMTTQRANIQKNELANADNRSYNDDKRFVIEEKHNGAFQVTKTPKPTPLNQRQPQNWTTHETTESIPAPNATPYSDCDQRMQLNNAKPRNDKPTEERVTPARNIIGPTPAVKKEHQTPERIASNSAQRSRTVHREDQVQAKANFTPKPAPEPVTQTTPVKAALESKIPIPKSLNKSLDYQRSQSASPVAQRRALSNKQETSQSTRNIDITETRPKYAWNSSLEKEDNAPEIQVPYHTKKDNYYHESATIPDNKQLQPLFQKVLQSEDYNNYSSEDEIKVYNTENTPMNSSLVSSLDDLHEAGNRCSLNLKTTTNVKLVTNHPLLVNASVHRTEEENARLFENRHGNKDERFMYPDEGKTMVFNVEGDYEIEETLSMLSRSSSVASISSFDQQSLHDDDDESFGSDLSHHTSGIESPSELSDSPCQTMPNSPQKKYNPAHLPSPSNDISEQGQMLSFASEMKSDLLEDDVTYETNESALMSPVDKRQQIGDSRTSALTVDGVGKEQKFQSLLKENKYLTPDDEIEYSRNESRHNNSRASSSESVNEMSPTDRRLLEQCIKSGIPQDIIKVEPKVRRQENVQHVSTCICEKDRMPIKKTFDMKEEYESHSENEEKGKEDERKAEKKILLRMTEYAVKEKLKESVDSNKKNYPNDKTIFMDQKGNRRPDKRDTVPDKMSAETAPTHLDFLMAEKANCHSSKKSSPVEDKKNIEAEIISCQNVALESSDLQEIECKREMSEISSKEKTDDTSTVSGDTAICVEASEKDVDCCDKEYSGESDECMVSSSILYEAKEIADALLGARVDSTEDMTVSTLSCLSDIDNARPPSAMGDLECLSLTNSAASDEGLKEAVANECQKLFGKQKHSTKKSLLRELQIGRLNSEHGSSDHSKDSNDSPENLSLKSCTSDLLGNVNPPSLLDDMTFTASSGSSEAELDREDKQQDVVMPYNDSMSERMHDAAAMAQLYAKELSNITGNCGITNNDVMSHIKIPSGIQEVMEVTIADATDLGCDTIGSDTELEDDLPCDDEDPGSDTLQAPFHSSLSREDQGEGSIENLTVTLTEEPPRIHELSPYQDDDDCLMTAEDFRALQENADMILNTLRNVEISDCADPCSLSAGDMLEDETMSLVSNESDEEFMSPDGSQKRSPRSDMSPMCNGMIALPQYASSQKTPGKKAASSLPLFAGRKNSYPSGMPSRGGNLNPKIRNSYPEAIVDGRQSIPSVQKTKPENMSKIKAPTAKYAPAINHDDDDVTYTIDNSGFDSRTFTRRKTTIPRNMVPSIPSSGNQQDMISPSANRSLNSMIANYDSAAKPKSVASKVSAAWKTVPKMRSKSAVDANRNAKMRAEKTLSNGSNSSHSSKDDESDAILYQRSSQTSSPKSPLSRSSTFEKLNDDPEASPSIRRPNTLSLIQKVNSPKHVKTVQRTGMQKQAAEGQAKPRRFQHPEVAPLVSPTTYQSANGIPKSQPKVQGSMIPSRKSMIPMPAKYGSMDN